jgi:hypothetical protein
MGCRGRAGCWGSNAFGWGGGDGGWRNWYHVTGLPRWGALPAGAFRAAHDAAYALPAREQEIDLLTGEAEWLSNQLNTLNQRIDELAEE